MNRPALSRNLPGDALGLPPELAQSTVSEIASWLVGLPLDAVERELICQTLEACGGDRAAAASVLGISLPALRKKITAYAVRGQPIPGTETNANRKPRAKTAPEQAEPPHEAETAPDEITAAAETALTEIEPTAAEMSPQPDMQAQPVTAADEFSALAAQVFEAAGAETAVLPGAQIVSFPPPAARDVLDPRGIDAPQPGDFTFGEETAARAVMPEPSLAVPPPANDLQAVILPPPPPAPRKAFNLRWTVAAALAALLIAPIAYGLLKQAPKNATSASIDRVQLQVSVREQPMPQPLEQRIAVPAWVMPPERGAAPPVVAERAAPAASVPAPVVEPAPAAAAAPAVFAPDMSADVAMELGAVNTLADLRMELGPVNLAADLRMELAPPDSQRDLAMALSPPDSMRDVAMALTPPNAEHDVAMALGPVDIAADARMEPGDWQASLAGAAADAGETTGSIPVAGFFRAPERAPMPRERLDPDEKPRPVAVRPRAPEPARAEPPAVEPFFLFNIFGPREGRKGLLGGAAQGGAN